MAFPAASGYGNLPLGNFSPVIYSKKVLNFFKTVSIVDEITNTEFEGEINQMGDTVRILKAPEVTVTTYTRGKQLTSQDLNDEDLSMVIDQAYAYQFQIDDIEKKQSHVGWAEMSKGNAAYKLRDTYDQNVFAAILAGATTQSATGTSGSEADIGYTAGADFTPLNLINRLARYLDDNSVPDDGGRWFTAKPQFYETLGQEDSKYIEANTMGDAESFIRQRKLGAKNIAGFSCYKSINVPLNANSKPTALAGHISAVATAKNILISETVRSTATFADIYRGLFVFGRKVLRREALFAANINFL